MREGGKSEDEEEGEKRPGGLADAEGKRKDGEKWRKVGMKGEKAYERWW